MTPLDLVTLDATALAAKVHAREVTARQLVDVTLQRIDEVEPTINAFRVLMTQEALAQADEIDSLSSGERAALPLAGVPVAIKDDTDVAGQSCESQAPRIDACRTRGAMRSLRAATTSAWLVPWNLTGQPALAVPTGLDDDHLPTAVHLAGRTGDEATLLALAAQIETARPFPRWTQRSGD